MRTRPHDATAERPTPPDAAETPPAAPTAPWSARTTRTARRWLGQGGARLRAIGATLPRRAIPLVAVIAVVTGLLGYGLGAAFAGGAPSAAPTNTNGTGAPAAAKSTVPDATQTTGSQPAKFVVDADGAKHFTLTAQQVMWQPVKGARVLAWTLDGTVPGPLIRVTAGDHVRITLINHLPEGTTLHWHGLEVVMPQDGVPGLGQEVVKPGATYTYDFTLRDTDAGTHWYHSHYDDLRQVSGGMYGAFLVDPRPGSVQAAQAIQADREYVMMISELGGYYVMNGKAFPETQPILLSHGQTVRLRLIQAGEMLHPMHLHGHAFDIRAMDGHTLAQPITRDTLPMAPGETYDLTFYGWAQKGNTFPFHCHVLGHVLNPGQAGSDMGGLIAAVVYQ